MTDNRAIEELQDQMNGEIAEFGEEKIGYTIEAYEMAIEALQKPTSETEVLKNIQRECKRRFVCTDCRFQEYDEFGFTNCKIHFPEFWIFDEQEAAAEDAQDTIPVQSGAEHDMQ